LSWWQHLFSLAQTLSTPVLGKRSRTADDSKLTDLPWLKELHAKIWNRKRLKPLLFRKVEVTQAHCAALERNLKKVYSDRDSPGYDGYHDVLNVKLNLLRLLPPADSLSQQHPDDCDNDDDDNDDDDSEGSNEDDPGIKSLFPSILSYLDLSALRMKEGIPERLPLPLLLRQEYDNISKLIKERPQNSGGPIRRFTFEESTVIEQITNAVQKKKPRHFVPLARTFPAVDSILYDPNDPNAVLTCIQITRNENHPIVVKALKQIQHWLRLRTPLGDLRPTESSPWRFSFVVPSGMMSTFTLQELDRDTARGVWSGKVDQYVVGLDEEIIFREISTTTSQQGEPQVRC
jgi:hypothetical protein